MLEGCDRSVGIATRYRLDGSGNKSRWGARFSTPIQTDPGAHLASLYSRYQVFPGGHAVAQLVEALRYKSEGRGFDSRWRRNFSLT